MRFSGPVRIGLKSVKANAVPMVVLWGVAFLILIAYYHNACVESFLKVLGNWQLEYGKLASFVNRVVFGGVIPGAFLVAQPSVRPRHPILSVAILCLWSGATSIPQDCWFSLLDRIFGDEPTVAVVFKKTLVDQIFWAMFVMTPLNSIFFPWWGNNLSWRKSCRGNCWRTFARYYVANLLTNWAVWIPVVVVIYSFPLELQMTVSSFTCSIWALNCCWLGEWKGGE